MSARSTLPFPFNTRLKLSTLVRIAIEVERDRGASPKCTIRERQAQLNWIAGHCRTVAEVRSAIENENA